MITIKLKKGKGKKLKEGHLWIFRGELSDRIPKGISPGPVIVEDHSGRFMCIGDYSPDSNIAVRVLSWKNLPKIGKELFERRIQNAYRYRKLIYPRETSYRLIFSEGDFLPGLIVDKYGQYLAVQPLTAAMENRKDLIYEILIDLFSPKGIVERGDSPIRKREGLETLTRVVYGDIPDRIAIKDGELSFYVDLVKGEKTGYFFDQRLNRRFLEFFSNRAEALDVFTYTGSFAIHAGYFGAEHITAVDISRSAIDLGIENSKLNGLNERIDFVVENAFDYLKKASAKNKKYDLIILDPPAFAKDRYSREDAYRGYKEINLRAFKMLRSGGILVSCSCSYNFSLPQFISMLKSAASDSGKAVKIIKISGQSPDHPICLTVPETNYLKAVFTMIME